MTHLETPISDNMTASISVDYSVRKPFSVDFGSSQNEPLQPRTVHNRAHYHLLAVLLISFEVRCTK